MWYLSKQTFSLQYGEKPLVLTASEQETLQQNGVKETKTLFRATDGLEIVRIIKQYEAHGAILHRLHLAYRGEGRSRQICNLCDFDGVIPMPKNPAWGAPEETHSTLFYMLGANDSSEDFSVHKKLFCPDICRRDGETVFSSNGGRSSDGIFPYFDVNQDKDGLIIAIGWSGAWRATMTRVEEGVSLRVGLTETDFYLLPDEEIDTVSVLLLPYSEGQSRAHNAFRALMREHFSPRVLHSERDLPLCINGGISHSSDRLLSHAALNQALGGSCNYLWLDAGWYGPADREEGPYPSSWRQYLGEWQIDPQLHPHDLTDVRDAAEANGMRMLLWFEPERAMAGTKYLTEHPEWFIAPKRPDWWGQENYLWNLGDKAAREGMIEMLDGFIRTLHIGCLRWDANVYYLPLWRDAEEEGRRGLFEIKYIMGLYEVWDTLSARFPDLLIDNCASGGKRLDFELYSRGIPLWRSDRQCDEKTPPEESEMHTATLSWYLPYHGTISQPHSLARFAFAPTLNLSPAHIEKDPAAYRRTVEEFLFLRPFMMGDFYPIFSLSGDRHLWGGHQYARDGEGVVLIFRRADSPYSDATVTLTLPDDEYELIDLDSLAVTRITAKDGAACFPAHLEKPRETHLYHYRRIV